MNRIFAGIRRGLRMAAGAAILSAAVLVFAVPAFADSLPNTTLSDRTSGPGATGWKQTAEGGWNYYLNGSLLRGTWSDVGGFWYYFDDNGNMLTGWQNIGGKEYFLTQAQDESHPVGALYLNTKTPDGCTVDENGVKIANPLPYDPNRPNPYGYSCVEVDITNQMMYCYINNELRVASPCVTGRPSGGRATAVGTWRINSKERNRYLQGYNSDGSRYKSWVNYWMPFHGGQGLHDARWRGAFGGEIYKSSGSHGCVNLPVDIAPLLYNTVWVGMPVIVHY